jgi:hypothetical protein
MLRQPQPGTGDGCGDAMLRLDLRAEDGLCPTGQTCTRDGNSSA